MTTVELLNKVISVVDSYTKKPEQFLSIQDKAAMGFRDSTKLLYDFTKEESQRKTEALSELVTKDFDEEQIWQQLELQNDGELSYFLNSVSRILVVSNELVLPISTTRNRNLYSRDNQCSDEEEKLSKEIMGEEQVSIKGMKRKKKKETNKHKHQKTSIVDDKFFKLQELDEYLTKEDRKETEIRKVTVDESDDESVDLFDGFSDDNEEEDETEDARLLKYADFFDSPNSEDETAIDNNENFVHDGDESDEGNIGDDAELEVDHKSESNDPSKDNQEASESKKKHVKFNLTNDSDDTDSLENKMENPVNREDAEIKSSLELRQERLQKRIHELEEAALSEKPWQLKGEVDAVNRPQNSLLEEYVEFDMTTRPAPIITEQTTVKLEDIIRQRIKDKAWDDVEKKFKPVETPLEYKKRLVLNQEKSKQSLAQIYEDEYVKQREALNPESKDQEDEEPKEHIEIREMVHSLFTKLDSLSNFHYTPKLAKPDIKIISNIPAINIEEVAPVATSDAALLAPEEIQAKPRGDLIGKAERTKTDMKRERRKKKLRQRERQNTKAKREKLVEKLKPGLAKKYDKEKTAAMMTKLGKDRNVLKMDESNQKALKSSTAFFNHLQDQVKSHINSKVNAIHRKKDKNAMSAVKLKL